MIVSNNKSPSLLFVETAAASVAAIASGEQRIFMDPVDNEMFRKDETNAVYRLTKVLSNPMLADPTYVASGDVWFMASGASPFRGLYACVQEGALTVRILLATY